MTRGALEALAYVLQFTTAANSGGHIWSTHQWRPSRFAARARNGDLVILGCAPVTEWCIGWLLEGGGGEGEPSCNDRYLIENLLDGRTAWWTNVDLRVLEEARNHPRWRWTDAQMAFAERWYKLVRDSACIGFASRTRFEGNAAVVGVHRWERSADGGKTEAEPVSVETRVPDFRKLLVCDLKTLLTDLNARLADAEHERGIR